MFYFLLGSGCPPLTRHVAAPLLALPLPHFCWSPTLVGPTFGKPQVCNARKPHAAGLAQPRLLEGVCPARGGVSSAFLPSP